MDYDELEHFLLHLSSYSEDPEIAAVACENFAGLASRCHRLGRDIGSADELNQVVNMLSAILSSAQGLPSKAVARVHSFVGMIRAKQNKYDCAIRSFLKALWLQTSKMDTPALDIAMTENRLGLAYGNSGNLPQAISLLEKSLEDYEKAKMKVEHFCVVEAQSALADFRSRHLQKIFQHKPNRYGKSYGKVRRLSHIQEEREFHSERGFSRWW